MIANKAIENKSSKDQIEALSDLVQKGQKMPKS